VNNWRDTVADAEEAFGDTTETINALDYVAADHPLRPARKSLVLDHPRTLNRFRNHPEFWWEVLLAMQRRAKINQDRATDQTLRDEILRLAEQVQELRREQTLALSQKDAAEAKIAHLNQEAEKLKRERDRDQAMIAHLCQPGHARAFQTADEVLNALEKVYGDRNKRARAIDEMRTLKMGRRPFDDF
jgi:hypothetical protein